MATVEAADIAQGEVSDIIAPEEGDPVIADESDGDPMDNEELEIWTQKTDDDARMDLIIVAENTMQPIFDNRAFVHPHGFTHYDYPAIPKERRAGLEGHKMKVRHENYSYLHAHPELDALIQLFLHRVLLVQPIDPVHFAAEFFAKKTKLTGRAFTENELEEQKKKIERYRNNHPKVKMPTVNMLLMKTPDDLIFLQRLCIGPQAHDFKYEGEAVPIEAPVEKEPKKPYCGCKDRGRKTVYRPDGEENSVLKDIFQRFLNEDADGHAESSEYEGEDSLLGHFAKTPFSATEDERTSSVGAYEADDDEDEY